jgi:hypothetical protein
LAALFAFGVLMCGLTIVLLAFPGSVLDALWRLNPSAHLAFGSGRVWPIALMLLVGISCGIASVGLAKGALCGVRAAPYFLASI